MQYKGEPMGSANTNGNTVGNANGNGALRAAVVGSGFGGLAMAIRLQAAGIRTVLFEARDKPGGRAYVYQQDGYTFDAGPTVITAPRAMEEGHACCTTRATTSMTS